MKNIAIVNPPYPEKGHHYVLGIGYLAASLRQNGYNPTIFDEPCFSYSVGAEKLISDLRGFRPDAIGIALPTSLNLHYSYDLIARLKKALPDVPLIAGGLHSTLMPREVLEHDFDYAIMGDGEETFDRLLKALADGSDTKMPGVAFMLSGDDIFNGGPSFIDDINTIPFPENRIISVVSGDNTAEKQLVLVTSRGCFRKCAFCVERHLNRGRRKRSVENIVSEIEQAYREHSVRRIHFLDSSFLESRKHVEQLCSEIIELTRNDPISWKCMARADHLDHKILATMKAAGCDAIYVGMESVNDSSLKKLHKGITSRHLYHTVDLVNRSGINLSGYFIAGIPWETEAELNNTKKFYHEMKDRMEFLFLTALPFPSTDFYLDYHKKHGFTQWWLKDNLRPVEKPGQPVFRWLYSRDEVLERNFYNYNPRKWKAIAWFPRENRPAEKIHGFRNLIRMSGRFAISTFSRFLYAISPNLEHAVAAPIYLYFHRYFAQKQMAKYSRVISSFESEEAESAKVQIHS